MRSYGFAVHELLDEENPCFDREVDPKTGWALRHLHLFPVEVNRAEYGELLRVPGIGVQSARRIVRARRQGHLGPDELGRLGVVMKRARYFVTARGKFLGDCTPDAAGLRARLATPGGRCTKMEQLSLFDGPAENLRSVITGEI
jgi:predicted DNA-binding helix-hairpin-helix protein